MLLQETAVGLVAELGQQRCDGRLYVARQPQINGRAPSDVLGIPVDLDLLNVAVRKKFRKWKISAEQQQQIRVVNGLIGSAVAKQPGHPDGMGIVMLQPLLPPEGISDGSLQLARECQYIFALIAAAVAAENRHLLGGLDHDSQL